MATIPPRRRQSVLDCVSTLNNSVYESLADLKTKALQSCLNGATAVVSVLRSTVVPAKNNSSEEWNAADCDLLASLPTELARECFRQLDFRDRITASHVSRSWRRVALSDPALWNKYVVPFDYQRDDAVLADALSTMLSRSSPLPFHFACTPVYQSLSDLVIAILSQNMDRIASLRIGPDFSRLSHLDAPMLTRISYGNPLPVKADFPADWVALRAPRLELLDIDCPLPSDLLPMPTLRNLIAHIPHSGAFDKPLSVLFPNLTTLTLGGMTQQSLKMLFRLPRSLAAIYLSAEAPSRTDYTHFLHANLPLGVRELSINYADRPFNAIALFIQRTSASRTMEVNDVVIHLRDIETNTTWSIGCEMDVRMHWTPDVLPQLRYFLELTLPLYDFAVIHKKHSWDRQLPDLRRLTLTILEPDVQMQRLVRRRSARSLTAGIHMPLLESLTLSSRERITGAKMEMLASIASYRLPAMLSNAPQPLASICIQQESLTDVARDDVAPFLALARRVVLENTMHTQSSPVVFSAEQSI